MCISNQSEESIPHNEADSKWKAKDVVMSSKQVQLV